MRPGRSVRDACDQGAVGDRAGQVDATST